MEKRASLLKKILMVVLIILLLAILVAVIHTMRNFSIIRGLQDKFSAYADSTNYHVKTTTTEPDGSKLVVDFYQKGDKQARFIESGEGDSLVKLAIYNNGERIDMFTETAEEKIATLGSNNSTLLEYKLYNALETKNMGQTLFLSFLARIKEGEVDGKECYVFEHYCNPNVMYGVEENASFYEKDTGF